MAIARRNGRWGLVIAPNGSNGLHYDNVTQTWVGDKEDHGVWDEEVWAIVQAAKQRGRWKGIVVGGCCKTGPSDIASLRKRIDSQ